MGGDAKASLGLLFLWHSPCQMWVVNICAAVILDCFKIPCLLQLFYNNSLCILISLSQDPTLLFLTCFAKSRVIPRINHSSYLVNLFLDVLPYRSPWNWNIILVPESLQAKTTSREMLCVSNPGEQLVCLSGNHATPELVTLPIHFNES